MSQLTANQLWKKSGTTKDFTTWLNEEKVAYSKYAAGKDDPMPFLDWLDRKLQRQENLSDSIGIFKDIFGKTKMEIDAKNQAQEDTYDDQYRKARILGMPKPLFYASVTLIVVAATVSVIYVYRNKK